MEDTKKRSSKKKSSASADSIKAVYVEALLTEGKRPASVFRFCLDQGIKEDEFYSWFGSFEGLEQQIWKGFMDETVALLTADTAYSGFNARDRTLAFYFTLLEVLRRNRSFVLMQYSDRRTPGSTPDFLRDFRKSFEHFFEQLIGEAKTSEEVASRPYLERVYPQAFWIHFEFVLHFWMKDNSAGFEKTDAAVEKSVNVAFDLISKGAIERAIDFVKFLYQNRV